MSAVTVSLITFSVAFGGAVLGIALRRVLPAHHLDGESKDTIKVGVGFIATMTALVLGLVTASAKRSFDEVAQAVKHSAVEVLALDRALARFGDEAAPIRHGLKEVVAARIDMLWPQGRLRPPVLDPVRSGSAASAERLADAIRSLTPRNDAQRALQTRAVELAESLLQARWITLAGGAPTVPLPFLGILLFWIALTFTSYGLLAPRNPTVLTVLFVCAASIGAALFLVLEMDGPFDGLLRVSAEPLLHAQRHLGQ